MYFRGHLFVAAFLALVAPLPADPATPTPATAPRMIVVAKDVPKAAKRYVVTLTRAEALANPPSMSTGEVASPVVDLPPALREELLQDAGDSFVFQAARGPSGKRHLVAVRKLGGGPRQWDSTWAYRGFEVDKGGKVVPKSKGTCRSGERIEVEFADDIPPLGADAATTISRRISFDVSSDEDIPRGGLMISARDGVAGRVSVPSGQLGVLVYLPSTLERDPEGLNMVLHHDTTVPGLEGGYFTGGNLRTIISIKSVEIQVESIAEDLSSIVLVLRKGSFEEMVDSRLQPGRTIPAFSQVDLLTRATVTGADVRRKAAGSPGIIFIFGGICTPREDPENYSGRVPEPGALPLATTEIVRQATAGADPPPIVVFVTREVCARVLWEEWRDTAPAAFVLSEFVDPLEVTIRGNGPRYGGAQGNRSGGNLRETFGIPNTGIVLVACDAGGVVRHVAFPYLDFLPALAAAREALLRPAP